MNWEPADATDNPAAVPSGDQVARIQAAMDELDGLHLRPTGTHVAVFERVHVTLTDALSAIDEV
ncbi:MAG TPA: hypothetical protein VGH89_42225 [Pseudonocardia sp.]|jgi:hypothetical protein